MAYTITQYLSLLVLTTRVTTTSLNTNGSTFSEIRQPRVSGRIVKLYSDTRPDPIQCTEDGFKADHKDCSVFYRCTQNSHGKFAVFRFQCGPGTVYDPETEICNFPQNTKRSECGGLFSKMASQTILEPIFNDNEIEFNLEQELPSPISLNTKFNNKLILPKKDMSTNAPIKFFTVTEIQRDTSPVTTNRIQFSNPKKDDICTRDGFIGDSENCRKFYRCVSNGHGGYIRYEFSCSESTIWDDDMQGCNHGWAVKRRRCGRGNDEVENIIIDKGLNTNNEKITDSQNNHFGSRIPNKDKVEKVENKHINVERKTTTPIIQLIKEKSTEKAHAIKINQNHAYSTDYNDDNNDVQSSNTTTTFTTSKTTTTTTPITSTISGSTASGSNSCSSSGFMGDPNDCKKFYRCVDNGKGSYTRYEFSCGEGTVWDGNIEACNHAWAVKKCGEINKQEAETTHSIQSTTDENTYQSSTPSESNDNDDDDDLGYGNINQSSLSTETTVQSTEQSTSESDKICTKDGFIGDNSSCKKFYRCVDNGKGSYTKYEFSCGDGTVWDSKIEACNHEYAVEKCGNSDQDVTKEISTTHKEDFTTEKPVHQHTTSSVSNLNDDYDVGYGQQTNTQAPTSTEAPDNHNLDQNNTNKCTSAGFVGDDNDCKKFYRCVQNENGGYTRYEFSCGEGTVWDPKIEGCNHPGDVEKCGGKNTEEYHKVDNNTSTTQRNDYSTTKEPEKTTALHEPSNSETSNCKEEGFMADKRDCTKFYRCVSNQNGRFTKYEFTCGEGTVWDSEIQGCNHPPQGNKCRKSDAEHTEQPPNKEETKTTSTEQPTTTKITQQPNKDNNDCKSEGFHPNKLDCKKFYRCVDDGRGGYTKYDFYCGEGTVWDQEVQSCNYPSSRNNCSQDYETTSEPSSSSQQQKETTSIGTTEATFSTTSPGNKDICESEGFYGNSNDCKKFYRCVDDGKGGYTKFEFNCGEGTVWVQEIQACDHDNDIGSCSTSNSDMETHKSTTSSTYSSTKDDTNYSSSEKSTSSTTPEPSTSACTAEGFYANQNDCRKFYRCVENENGGFTKYEFTCGEGTAWDSDIQGCNHKSEVKSCRNPNQSQQSNKEETSTQSNDCAQSTQSTKDTEVTHSTDTHTTQSSTTSSSGEGQSDHCNKEGYFGNSKDCTKFYRCVDNGKGSYTKYDFTCGEGTVWDQDVQTCNHPGDVVNSSCQDSGPNKGEHTTTKTTTQASSTSTSGSDTSHTQSSATTGTTQNNANCSQENSTSKPVDNTITCPKAGFYPNPDDCKKFYRCVDWNGDGQRYSVFHFDCGEGTIWDPELQTCNYEESVYPPRDCSSKQSAEESSSEQTTEGTTETTTTESTTKNEETTTKKSTTTTTTEKSTTAEGTEQPTTTEQSTTTTEPSTTSTEQSTTTTEQSTTTTEQSTTTTEQSTTTTEQSTTTEKSTSEQTTTEQPTTEQTTIEQTTTEQTTEQSSTTTEESSTTTEQSTSQTEQSTTNESTTEQSTTTTEQSTTEESSTDSQESTTEDSSTESSSNKECPETDDDQYLYVCPTGFKRHPKYCNLFYQCTEDDDSHDVKVAVFHCPNNTIYDEGKTQCVEEKEADKKCDGEMAEKRRIKRLDLNNRIPITVSKNKKNCPAVGHYPFEKNDECSPAFLKCSKTRAGIIRGFVYRCPENHIYWSVSRRCEPIHKIRNCNNIDSSWNKRWEIPLETKNVAP